MTLEALDGGGHPGRLELEDWFWSRDGGFGDEGAASDGGPGLDRGRSELATLERHLERCAECRAVVDGLQAERDGFDLPLTTPARARSRAPWYAAAALLLLAPTLFLLRPDPTLRAKGGEVAFEVLVEHSGGWTAPADPPGPGAEVRFSVTSPEPAWVAIVAVQDDGVRGVLYPVPGTQPGAVPAGARVVLDGSAVLDEYAGGESAELWLADRPFGRDQLARLSGGPVTDATFAGTLLLR